MEDILLFAPELLQEIDGYKPTVYGDQSSADVERNFWYLTRNRLIVWAIRNYFPTAENFFELGCGTGYVLSNIKKYFPKFTIYGSDVLYEGLHKVTSLMREVEFFQMDAKKIPFENEFHLIGAFDVLEHVHEDEAVLLSMHRAVKPGGGIILTVPQHTFLWSSADEYACHVRRYTLNELRNKVMAAGFKIIRITSFVSLLLPVMVIVRMRIARKFNYKPSDEYRINPLLNSIFTKIMDFERLLIRIGCFFPVGGSLLLLAIKR